MKKLIIAEKPSVARDIAKALGGFESKKLGDATFFERADCLVSSAIGHLVELVCPKEADPGYDLERLPAMPDRFGLAVVDKTAKQFKVLKQLMERPDVTALVNACDAGREGELIFRYIYMAAGCRKEHYRMWMQSMTPPAIREAFGKMYPGKNKDGLFFAGQCRSESDWLIGINATRGAGELGSRQARKRVKFSVGRVVTPVTAILVDRELEIRNFKPRSYYEVHAEFALRSGAYPAKWIKASTPGDDGGSVDRAFDKAEAEAILAKCEGNNPTSIKDASRESLSKPPGLFDLTGLQQEANGKFGFTAKNTLAIAQALYEKHKVLTYPRTDSRHLPEDYGDSCRERLEKLGGSRLAVAAFAKAAVSMVKPDKRIFDNSKISDHFAIIPTGIIPEGLDASEQKIYDLVCKRFVAAFYPPAKFNVTVRDTTVAGEIFRVTGRVMVEEGWQKVYGREAEDEDTPALPPLQAGETGTTTKVRIEALKTKAPPFFTEKTLLGAMESAGAKVDDESLREAMRDHGLGTPATRATTIEKIVDPDIALGVREKKSVRATEKAIELIAFLRKTDGLSLLTSPATTGEWEMKMGQIEKGTYSRAQFMSEIREQTKAMIESIRKAAAGLPPLAGGGSSEKTPVPGCKCPHCGKSLQVDDRALSCTSCDFKVWRVICGRQLSVEELTTLVQSGELATLDGFVSPKTNKAFRAGLRLADKAGKTEFVFEAKEK